MDEINREPLRELLKRWDSGELDARQVHEHAEQLWDSLEQHQFPREDRRSIAAEVLSQLDILNHQLITPEDIPAMMQFLDTLRGSELDGWKRWQRYWDELDMDERIESLKDNNYYSAYPVPRRSPKPHEVS
ncbi:MAG: hypothetical protein WBO69_12435 [Thermoanaerobaculia bacterium]